MRGATVYVESDMPRLAFFALKDIRASSADGAALLMRASLRPAAATTPARTAPMAPHC